MKFSLRVKSIFMSSLMIVTFLNGCGGEKETTESRAQLQTFKSQKVILQDSANLTLTESKIEGTGSLVFDSPLAGVKSDASFSLEFEIDDGGSVEIHGFSDQNLGGGIVLRLSRSGDDLSGSLVKNENSISLSSSVLQGQQGNARVSFTLDIHNNETPAHVLIWSGKTEDFSEENASYNSEDGPEAPGNGSGRFWGLKLEKAKVFFASSGEAKFVHDH